MGETLMQIFNTMSPSAKQELYDFALFLASKKTEENTSPLPKRQAGIGKDPDFYMAPDFDETPDCFKEYI